jgi:hypothetical protein
MFDLWVHVKVVRIIISSDVRFVVSDSDIGSPTRKLIVL